jgi:hypothetical protein
MRTHKQIIAAAGGYRSLAEKLGQPPSRVRFWERRQAIPPEAWRAVVDAGLATADELLDVAANRALSAVQSGRAA